MKKQTYQEIIQKLKELDSLLSQLDIPKKADRFRFLISQISQLEEAYQKGTIKELVEKINQGRLLWSLVEAEEFTDLLFLFRNFNSKILKEKLQNILDGPVFLDVENETSNFSRNIMFELSLASRFSFRGLHVSLQTNPDLICELNGQEIFIQCKRPFLEKNIPKNINAASRQLTRDLNNDKDKNSRGLLAISVSRIRNPGDKLFIVKKEQDIEQRLGNNIETLAKKFSKSCNAIEDKRIIGTLFHIITPLYVEEDSLLTVSQYSVISKSKFVSKSDLLLLESIMSILSPPYADE